jgi:hypothetical protein
MDMLRQGLSVAKRELDAYVPGATTKIKQLADKAKAIALSMSELEMKVMDATNHEPWGPHGKDMQGERGGASGAACGLKERRTRAGPETAVAAAARRVARHRRRARDGG